MVDARGSTPDESHSSRALSPRPARLRSRAVGDRRAGRALRNGSAHVRLGEQRIDVVVAADLRVRVVHRAAPAPRHDFGEVALGCLARIEQLPRLQPGKRHRIDTERREVVRVELLRPHLVGLDGDDLPEPNTNAVSMSPCCKRTHASYSAQAPSISTCDSEIGGQAPAASRLDTNANGPPVR